MVPVVPVSTRSTVQPWLVLNVTNEASVLVNALSVTISSRPAFLESVVAAAVSLWARANEKSIADHTWSECVTGL